MTIPNKRNLSGTHTHHLYPACKFLLANPIPIGSSKIKRQPSGLGKTKSKLDPSQSKKKSEGGSGVGSVVRRERPKGATRRDEEGND